MDLSSKISSLLPARRAAATGAAEGGTPPSDYTGPLDLVPGANWQFAYGVRALSAAKLGQNIFRLRRNSDNAEMNFAADATTGLAPVASIDAWRGVADGFLVTLYDQYGIKNVTQADQAKQPVWDSALNGGKGGFTSFGNFLVGASASTFGNAISAFVVARKTSGGAFFGANGGSGEDWVTFDCVDDNRPQLRITDNNTFATLSIKANTSQSATLENTFVLDGAVGAGAGSLSLNGVNIASTLFDESPLEEITTPVNALNNDSVNNQAWYGDWYEALCSGDVISAPNRTLIRADEATFYGITL